MKLKKTILCFLILSILVCACGCALQIDENREYEYDDFIYYYVENSYNVLELSDSGRSSEILYPYYIPITAVCQAVSCFAITAFHPRVCTADSEA